MNAQATKNILRNYHHFVARQYNGDYDATDTLIDLRAAISAADLTPKQAQALTLVYERDWSQVQAAGELGVTKQRAGRILQAAVAKVAAELGEVDE